MRGANLCRADLRGADLYEADLRGAELYEADLRGSDLRGADLHGADLCGAELYEAQLYGTKLYEAKNVPYVPMACPDSGAFVGWKKCRTHGKNDDIVIIKLLIPENARRCSSTGRKCRAEKAVVLEIQNQDGSKANTEIAYSIHAQHFAYKIGETVVPEKPFDADRWLECASGIHFFINRQEAVDY